MHFCVWGGLLPHHRAVLGTAAGCPAILTLATWGEHQIPQAKGLVPPDHPPLQTLIASPG